MGFKKLCVLMFLMSFGMKSAWGALGSVDDQTKQNIAAIKQVSEQADITAQAVGLKGFMDATVGQTFDAGTQQAFADAIVKFVRDAQALIMSVLTSAPKTSLLGSNQQAYVAQTMQPAVQKAADTVKAQ